MFYFWFVYIGITPVNKTDSRQSKLMQIIPILGAADCIYSRKRVSKVHGLCWNYAVNELARWAGRVETAALIFSLCLSASPVLRACGRELCWKLAARKHSPQIFWCQLQRLTGGTDGAFPGNYNIMLFPIRNTGESWLGDLSTRPSRWLGRKLLWNRFWPQGPCFQ